MKRKLIITRDQIEDELTRISMLVESLNKAAGQKLDEEIQKRVFSSILADFYMAVEKIFKIIAKDIDLELPEGDEWHKTMLRQMSVPLPEIRPQVIDKDLFRRLEEYLKFRHLVRNIYGFQLNNERFKHLVEELPEVADSFKKQIYIFFDKMQEVADSV